MTAKCAGIGRVVVAHEQMKYKNLDDVTMKDMSNMTRSLENVCHGLCTYQCKAGGGGGGDLIVSVVPGVGHLTDLVLPGEGIFESFFARRGDI